jgi:DNA adenine methylase
VSAKPILRWPGGKRRMLKHLLPLIPEHVCYCELFAGGLALLMAKPRSPVEIINDINGDLVALYRNVQYHLPAILDELQFFFSSRKALLDCIAQPGITEIQRAARFLLKSISFGGMMHSFAVAKTAGGGAAFSRARNTDLLGKAHERLDNVVVEQLPYERCIELYDSRDSFFFLDPPYVNKPTGSYEGFTEKQMRDLAKRLRSRSLKGKWLLTVDDSPLNRDLFNGCQVRAVETPSGCVNRRTSNKTFGELIIQP